jgi:predicted MFS family arabinose efflux permease
MATLGILAAATSWQVAVAAIAASAGVILVLIARCYRDPPSEPTVDDAARSGRFLAISTPELRLVLLAGIAFALVNAALVVYTSFTPTLLIERGRSETQAGVLASLTSWALIGTVVLAGYLLDRARHGTSWLALSAGLTAMVCLATPIIEPTWLWIVLFGIVSAPVTVGSMALPGQVLSPQSRNSGFGLFFTMNYLGFGLLPPVAGFLLDLTYDPATPLWFSGGLYVAILPCLLIFHWLRRRPGRKTESRANPLSDSAPLAESS